MSSRSKRQFTTFTLIAVILLLILMAGCSSFPISAESRFENDITVLEATWNEDFSFVQDNKDGTFTAEFVNGSYIGESGKDQKVRFLVKEEDGGELASGVPGVYFYEKAMEKLQGYAYVAFGDSIVTADMSKLAETIFPVNITPTSNVADYMNTGQTDFYVLIPGYDDVIEGDAENDAYDFGDALKVDGINDTVNLVYVLPDLWDDINDDPKTLVSELMNEAKSGKSASEGEKNSHILGIVPVSAKGLV